MAVGKSIKMYLTIFVATTCIYMVLYQYHISRQPIPSPDIIKNKDISAELTATETTTIKNGNGKLISSTASLVKRYNLFLWSPMSLLTTQPKQQKQHQERTSTSASSSSPSSPSATVFSTQLSSTSHIRHKLSRIGPAISPISSPITLSMPPVAASSSSISASNSSSSTQHKKSALKSNAISSISTDKLLPHTNNNTNSNNTIANKTTTTNTTATSKLLSATKITTTKPRSTFKKTIRSTSLSSASASTSTTTRFKSTFANKFVPVVDPPPLYIITPTYRRPEQLAELTRLGYTLKHIVNLLWLVIEDANKTSPLVIQTLNRIGVPYEYFLAPMPEEYKKTKKGKPRGVSNRNRGLEYLRANATEGVFYFADDDNTYDISIFEQMRYTKKVSMWPVGLVTNYGISSPIIRKGKIDGFYDGWIGGRKYPVDMAGFAVNVKFLLERPAAKMPFKVGYEEDGFLKSLAPLNVTEIELLATNCTEILTWHTQTKKNNVADALNMSKYRDTNLVFTDQLLVRP